MRACPVSDGCDMAVQCLIAGREKRYSEGLVGGPRTSLEKGRGGGRALPRDQMDYFVVQKGGYIGFNAQCACVPFSVQNNTVQYNFTGPSEK